MVQSISACCISKLLLEAKMHGMSKRRREREREREREGKKWYKLGGEGGVGSPTNARISLVVLI